DIEVEVAIAYGLSLEQFERLLLAFPKVSAAERETLLTHPGWKSAMNHAKPATSVRIANHVAPALSAIDLRMVRSIPPGGNWKDIPSSIPSKRLAGIRKSYAAGEGSRSTYYGRLRADAPAYTISTYFPRPGNGCHIHYDFAGGQHRTISYREAARLQSFPDDFVFSGTKTSICKQIGNAVPPLLAYQLALHLGTLGVFLDLFSGAGGLALGFKWAGWKPILANDMEPSFLETYRKNVHEATLCGDVTNDAVLDSIVNEVRRQR
ncbi:unnamed protein product, partial [marine sediment metagenome]